MAYAQSQPELENHLAEQLGFLQRSADAFDQGQHSEAKRIATTLRILVHDTKHSKSLLEQLGRKTTTLFVDSADAPVTDSVVSYHGLVIIEVGPDGHMTPIAPLDLPNASERPRVEFERWWNSPIFIDAKQKRLSRRDLVLTIADQDGGAHVDPVLESTYADLARQNSIGWEIRDEGTSSRPLSGIELIAVRQIGHEILKSLLPGYVKNTVSRPGTFGFGSLSVVDITEEVAERRKIARAEAEKNSLSRNAPCPCGQPRRYKYCCGSIES